MTKHQITEDKRSEVNNALAEHLANKENVIKTRIVKKLNNLYDRNIFIKNDPEAFINLSDYTPNENKYLNLGINCHLQHKYKKIEKRTELELLFQNLENLQN